MFGSSFFLSRPNSGTLEEMHVFRQSFATGYIAPTTF
jgi:hypothetical protein